MPGVDALFTPGHSPGHMAVLIGGALVAVADVLLTPLYIEHPECTAAFDEWPEAVVATRRRLLRRLVDGNLRIAAYHFPPPGTGRVTAEGGSGQWLPDT